MLSLTEEAAKCRNTSDLPLTLLSSATPVKAAEGPGGGLGARRGIW